MAGVGLHGEQPIHHRRLQTSRIALDDNEWHIVLLELRGDDAADASVAADDEVVLD